MDSQDTGFLFILASLLVIPTAGAAYGVVERYLWGAVLVWWIWTAYVGVFRGMVILPRRDPDSVRLEKIRAWVYLGAIPLAIIGNWLPILLGLSTNLIVLPLWVMYGMMPFYVILEIVLDRLPRNLLPKDYNQMNSAQKDWLATIMRDTGANTFPISAMAILLGFASDSFSNATVFVFLVIIGIAVLAHAVDNDLKVIAKVEELSHDLGLKHSKLRQSAIRTRSFKEILPSYLILLVLTALPVTLLAGMIVGQMNGVSALTVLQYTRNLLFASWVFFAVFYLGGRFLTTTRNYLLRIVLMGCCLLLVGSTATGLLAIQSLQSGSTDLTMVARSLAFFMDVPFFAAFSLIILPRLVLGRRAFLPKS